MNLKAYGIEMLEKQLGYAKKKGNSDYALQLEEEFELRVLERKKKLGDKTAETEEKMAEMKAKKAEAAKKKEEPPAPRPKIEKPAVVEQPTEPEIIVEPTPPLNSDGTEAVLTEPATEGESNE